MKFSLDLDRALGEIRSGKQTHTFREDIIMAGVPVLAYLKKELGFTVGEFQKLSDKDRNDLRQYARDEMVALGIEVAG